MNINQCWYLGVRGITLLAICLSVQTRAFGDLIIDVAEVGPNVVATFSGSLDLTGLTLDLTGSASGGVSGAGGLGATIVSGDRDLEPVDIYTGLVSFPAAIGPGENFFNGFFNTGDVGVGVQTFTDGPTPTGRVFVPAGYESGDPLSATTTFFNQTIDGLGLAGGDFIWQLPADSALVTIAVPEPSSLAFIAGSCFAFFLKRRKS